MRQGHCFQHTRPQYIKLRQAMSESATSYCVGDPLCISDAGKTAWCVYMGHRGAELQVQMLEKGADLMYRIGADLWDIDGDMIIKHYELKGDDDKAPAAFHAMGFRMIDGGTFVRHSDEQGNTLFPIGDAAFEMVSSDDDEDEVADEMSDFIVPDNESEPFTHAVVDNEFVRDTHAAVRGFNDWVPKDDREAVTRRFVIRQEARAVQVDDEARFARNMAGTNYSNPD